MNIHNADDCISQRRRSICCAGLSLFLISPCEAKPRRATLNTSLYSYLDRPIFDVYVNGKDFGVAPAQGFYGSNGVMLGQSIILGAQKVTWRYADSGETAIAKNIPIFNEIPKYIKWLALHIYDDNTVEFTFSKGTPDELDSVRGLKIIEAWDKKHGK